MKKVQNQKRPQKGALTTRNNPSKNFIVLGNNKTSLNGIDGLSESRRNVLRTIPKSLRVVPDRMYTRLCYEGMGPIVISNVVTFTAYRFRPSAAYDVDPLLGSTATPGFAEFAALYNRYRVTCSRCTMTLVNPSTALGLNLVVVPLNDDPGASPASAVVYSWPDNPYATNKMCGLAGSPPVTVSASMSTEAIFGSKSVYFDDINAALTNGVPSVNWYWGVGVMAGSVPVANISITLIYKIEMGIEFYDRKVLQA
jgi:hypothetical protein